LKGVLVPIEETIRGFNMIMDGEVDEYPEQLSTLSVALMMRLKKVRN
jgi:F-type H+-transporting ATPase subunit beta